MDLTDDVPKADILSMPTSAFVPSEEESDSLKNDTIYHIFKTATRYIPASKDFRNCVQLYIKHHYILESCKRSDLVILDLLDKSKNQSEEMISILKHAHENYISHSCTEIHM